MIVAVGSIRGAPGATSWALLLGAAWPREFSERRVVLEADPAGGVVGARYGMGVEPGAVRLVTGLRRNGTGRVALDDVARELSDGLFVVPGPESGETARPVWTEGATAVARQLERDPGNWITDVGRTDESNPSLVFVDRSALTIVVVGARQEDLVQLPARVASLRHRGSAVAVIVSGRCTFGADEIREFCRADEVWVVPVRDDLVEEVGRLLAGGRARRSWLWRHALDVAAGAFALVAARQPADSEAAQ